MSEENILAEMENLFLALSDRTRLRLLNLMRENEICVGYFTEVLEESQPKISRHLAYLRNAGIVSARREGKWMHYKIEMPKNPFAANLLQDTLEWLESQKALLEDYRKLEVIYRSASVPPTVFHAPTAKAFAETNMNSPKREELDTFLL